MTEKEIKKLIEECVREYINENKEILFEMALERQNFVGKVDGLTNPLVSHVLLLSYCALYDRSNRYFEHWKKEVRAFSFQLGNILIKDVKKSNQQSVKRKVLHELWIVGYEIDTDRMISNYWIEISDKENIDFELTQEMKNKYLEIIRNLMDLISESNIIGLRDYINNI